MEGLYLGVLSVSDSLALSPAFAPGPTDPAVTLCSPRLIYYCFVWDTQRPHSVLANSEWSSKHLRGRVREEERPSQHAWHLCTLRNPTCLARPLLRKSAHPRSRAEGLFPDSSGAWSSDGLRSSPQGTTLTSVCLLLLPKDPFDLVLCFCGVQGQDPLKCF